MRCCVQEALHHASHSSVNLTRLQRTVPMPYPGKIAQVGS